MSQLPPLQATRHMDGRLVVVLPEQALTDDALEMTRAQLLALSDGVLDGELDLDCAQLGYIGSSALSMLVGLHRRIDDAGGSLLLCNLVPHLRDLFRLTRLDTILHVRGE